MYMSKKIVCTNLTLLTAALVGCSAPAGTLAVSAAEHRRMAEQELAAAERGEDAIDHSAPNRDHVNLGHGDGRIYTEDYISIAQQSAAAAQHRRDAELHRAASTRLESFEQAECAQFSPAVRAVCPLMGRVDTVAEIEHGVTLRFAKGVPLKAVEAHVRCHLAFAKTAGNEGMDTCPLYLNTVEIQKATDSSIDLVVKDDKMLEQLRKRSAEHAAKRK